MSKHLSSPISSSVVINHIFWGVCSDWAMLRTKLPAIRSSKGQEHRLSRLVGVTTLVKSVVSQLDLDSEAEMVKRKRQSCTFLSYYCKKYSEGKKVGYTT